MTTKLVQKHLFKGTQEFEIVDDAVNVRLKSPFGQEETSTVMLAVLNSEPIISKTVLEFTSRVNNEPLLSLYLAKPTPDEFNAFVNLLKQEIQNEFNAFAGLKSGIPAGMEGNSYEAPPEFDGPLGTHKPKNKKTLTPENIESAIGMLKHQLDTEEIAGFLSALETLQADPMSDDCMSRVVEEFQGLGSLQGAVLSYAPYIIAILSDDPYESM